MAYFGENIFITYVDADHDLLKIWGQQDRTCATYIEKQLLQLMPEFNRAAGPDPTSLCKGMLCFAKYADDNYYRARIMSKVQRNTVDVLFVDYGNRDHIDLSNVRILDGQIGSVLSKIVAQADEFYLARVVALPGGWTAQTLDDIRRDLCYEEFQYKTVQQLNREKLIQICFHNNDYKNILFSKKIAREISLEHQQRYIMNLKAQNFNFKLNNSNEFPNPNRFMSDQAQKNINHHFEQSIRNNRQILDAAQSLTSRMHHLQHDVLCAGPSSSQLQKNLLCMGTSSNNPRHIYDQNILSTFNPNHTPVMPTQQMNVRSSTQENQALNPINNYVIEVLANQLKHHLLKDSQNAAPESSPSCYVTQMLQIGTTHSVYVTHVDDGPWSFSVQLVSNENELNQLIVNLNELNLIPVKLPLVLGYPCIAKSKEFENLCRGVVVNISHNAVKVFYVDFGNTEDLPLSSIYELPSSFFQTKVLSQKFSLSGLQQVKSTEDIKKAFVDVVENELLVLQVTNLEGENLPTCDLYLKGQNIKRILNDAVRSLNSWETEPLPKKGDATNIVVTWVESPQKFFVQLKKNQNDLKSLKMELKDWGRKGVMFRFEELEPGLSCCCCFSGDEEWYRAIIMSINSTSSVTVFYVDFGNVETVNPNMIRKIESTGLLKQLPTQAIQCCLHGYESGTSDESTTNFLKELILDNELNMKVVQTAKNRIIVKLFKNDSDISLALLQHLKSPQTWFSGQQEKSTKQENETIQRSMDLNKEIKNKSNEDYSSTDYENASAREYSRKFLKGTSNSSNCSSEKKEVNNWRDKKSSNISFHDSKNKTNIDSKKDFKYERQGKYSVSKRKPDTSNFERNSERSWRKYNENEDKKNASNNANITERTYNNYEQDWSYESNSKFNCKQEENRVKESENSRMKYVAANQPVKSENIAPPGTKLKQKHIQLGSTEEVIVTYFLNPNEIYVQLLSQQEDFRQMMEDIQNYYCDKLPVHNTFKFQEEDLVIVKFKEDEVLYRGKIIKVIPLTVRYIDYGNEELTEKERLWPMDKKFLKLEIQSVKCSLANLKPKDNNSWSAFSSKMDKIFDHDKYLCTFLVQKENNYEINLKIFENGEDVRDKLISLDYATSVYNIDEIPIDFALMRGEAFNVYISYIISVSEFYIQINKEFLQQIESDIERYVKSEECLLLSEKCSLNKGMLCLVRDEKNKWLRGELIHLTENSVLVQFIDYGKRLEVTYDKIKFIPDYLKKYQPQALESSLFSMSNECNVKINEKFKNCLYNSFTAFVHEANEKRLYLTLYNFNGAKIDFLADLNEAPSQIFPITNAPFIKQGIPVALSYILSPEEVYIHLINDTSPRKEFNLKLHNFYKKNSSDFEIDNYEEINNICAAKSITDYYWYRAKLLNVVDDEATVWYIDYGNIEEVPKANIRKLDSSFCYQYAFAKKVSLNLEYTEEEADSIALQISNLILNKECLGYFVKRENVTYAELFVDGVEISDMLLCENRKKLYDDLFENNSSVNSEIVKDSSEHSLITAAMEKESLKMENPKKVYISHVSNLNEFWILDENRSNEIDIFQNDLQKICSKGKSKNVVNFDEVVGGLYTDGLWYRVKVMDIKRNILLVQFIDFGNTFEIDLNLSAVIELPEDILKVPAFVNSCSLKGNWKKDATSRFESIVAEYQDPLDLVELESEYPKIVDLIANGVSITKRLIEEGLHDGPEEALDNENIFVYIVHINSPNDFYIQRECDQSIIDKVANELIAAESFESVKNPKENELYCLKFYEDDLWYRVKVSKRNGNEIEVHFIDYGNYDTTHVTELKLLPAALKNIPQLSLNCCLTYGSSHDTWSKEACLKFKEYLIDEKLKMKVVLQGVQKSVVKLFDEFDENLTDKLEPLCEKDKRIDVYVTHVNSPSDFYIVEANDDFHYISEILAKGSTFEELDDVREGIRCAYKSDSGVWYRGEILRAWDDYSEVLFIDNGYVCNKTNFFKKLPPEIEFIEPLAKNCSLNFSVKNIPESIKEEFINLTHHGDTLFRALIIKEGNRNVISLMLDGQKLEEVLLYTISENSEIYNICLDSENQNFENESNDDKSSSMKIASDIGTVGKYEERNIEDDIWARNPFGNETDEEKRYKFSRILGDNIEGFRSDDEKGILDGNLINSNIINIPDNDLLEDCAGNVTDFASELSFHSDNLALNCDSALNDDEKEGLCIKTSDEEKLNNRKSGSVEEEESQQIEVNAMNEIGDDVEQGNDVEDEISNEINSDAEQINSSAEMNENVASHPACEIEEQPENDSESHIGGEYEEERVAPNGEMPCLGESPVAGDENVLKDSLDSEGTASKSIIRQMSVDEISDKCDEISISHGKEPSSSEPGTPLASRRNEQVDRSEENFDGIVPESVSNKMSLETCTNLENDKLFSASDNCMPKE